MKQPDICLHCGLATMTPWDAGQIERRCTLCGFVEPSNKKPPTGEAEGRSFGANASEIA